MSNKRNLRVELPSNKIFKNVIQVSSTGKWIGAPITFFNNTYITWMSEVNTVNCPLGIHLSLIHGYILPNSKQNFVFVSKLNYKDPILFSIGFYDRFKSWGFSYNGEANRV